MGVSLAGFGRTRSSKEIREVRRRGRRASGSYVNAWCLFNDIEPRKPASLGIVTGRGFRTAVSRNRARRRLRGCIMDLRAKLLPGTAYLFEARPQAGLVDYHLLVKDVKDVIFRLSNE